MTVPASKFSHVSMHYHNCNFHHKVLFSGKHTMTDLWDPLKLSLLQIFRRLHARACSPSGWERKSNCATNTQPMPYFHSTYFQVWACIQIFMAANQSTLQEWAFHYSGLTNSFWSSSKKYSWIWINHCFGVYLFKIIQITKYLKVTSHSCHKTKIE